MLSTTSYLSSDESAVRAIQSANFQSFHNAWLRACRTLYSTFQLTDQPDRHSNVMQGLYPSIEEEITRRMRLSLYYHRLSSIEERITGGPWQLLLGGIDEKTQESISVEDMVDKAKAVFGLNYAQIARLTKVSRPSLYNHINGKEIPKSIAGYRDLYEVALAVEKNVSLDIRRGLNSVLVDGETLLGHLESSNRDPDHFVKVCRKIAERVEAVNRAPKEKRSIERQRYLTHLLTRSG